MDKVWYYIHTKEKLPSYPQFLVDNLSLLWITTLFWWIFCEVFHQTKSNKEAPGRMNDLWTRTLSILAEQLSQEVMHHWFDTVLDVERRDNTINILVGNDFQASFMETEYGNLLREIFYQLSGEAIHPVFSVGQAPLTERKTTSSVAATPSYHNSSTKNGISSNGYRFLPRYTFETFIVGSGNRFAHAAAMAVADRPAKSYNPLFIYGGSGLGKTHLMHAIGHRVMELRPNINVVYISTETFTSEFITAVMQNAADEFKHRYRAADILLVDDIQFLAKKDSTQIEFFHTFNFLHEQGKQIVISSDRKPDDIATLEDRLRSRFAGGLIIDIQPPDLETRIAILQHKVEQDNVPIVQEAINYIAERISSNIRELEGALNTVASFARFNNVSFINLDITKEVLANILPEVNKKPVSFDSIKDEVAHYFQLKVSDLTSSRRDQVITKPRHIAMYLCQELLGASLPAIGREFGGRDHTTVIHGCRKIVNDMQKDANLAQTIQTISKNITG